MAGEHQSIKRFALNAAGRDLIVGDVHGEFSLLERALDAKRFDPAGDRLFSVGDLIDRGRDSPAALRWLAQPWFHAVLGNHEDLALNAVEDANARFWWTRVNGGEWWLDQGEELRGRMLEAFRCLPLAIEVETAGGRAGIVHADVPRGLSWERFVKRLEKGDKRCRETALWGRGRARDANAPPVAGIDKVFCGHTPVLAPRAVGNVCFIDTGACYGRDLTLLCLDAPLPPADGITD